MKFLVHKIFTLLFFVYTTAFTTPQPYDAIINLGGDCQAAYQLYKHGLRKYALPFDALITPYNALHEMLKNKFEGFLAQNNFKLEKDENGETYVLDKKYGTRLIHDFVLQEDFLKGFAAVAEKYSRRIERLLEFITTSTYPLFIRKIITKEQAIQLCALLYVLREGKPFLLVALDDTEEIKADWQMALVKNYYLRQPQPYIWRGDDGAWKEIFQNLNLSFSDAKASVDER